MLNQCDVLVSESGATECWIGIVNLQFQEFVKTQNQIELVANR